MPSGIKLSYEEVNNKFLERNMELISKEYINAHTPLDYICQKHRDKGVQKIKYTDLQRHQTKCPYCMYEEGHPPNHLPEDIYKEVTEQNGYTYVSLYRIKQTTKIQFICPKHRAAGIQEAFWGNLSKGQEVCKVCNGTGRTTQSLQAEVRQKLPDLEILGKFQGTRKRIKVKCVKHNYIWEPLVYNLLSGYGCPICGTEKTASARRTSIEEKVEKFYSRRNDAILLTNPILSTDTVKCQCKTCGNIWDATYSNLVNPALLTGCPFCISSKGEREIKRLLDQWHIRYISQKTFKDCKYIHVLPFDFYLIDSNVCIEFQGIQHYRPVDAFGGEKEFQQTLIRDRIKRNYCFTHNIPLIEIEDISIDEVEDFLFDEFTRIGVLEPIK